MKYKAIVHLLGCVNNAIKAIEEEIRYDSRLIHDCHLESSAKEYFQKSIEENKESIKDLEKFASTLDASKWEKN